MGITTTNDIILKLNPCPFCGGNPDGSELLTGFSSTSTIYCIECEASAPYKIWNTRTSKEIERLKALLFHFTGEME